MPNRYAGPPLGATLALLVALAPAAASAKTHPLRVHESGRYLVQADGRPFFYLGDTAWELLHRLNREEIDLYLRNRAAKGFTVIQTVVLAELDGLNTPNANGDKPLEGNDPGKPNPRYFEHVDYAITRAEALGLTIGLLPTWGDKKHSRQNTPGPKVFNEKNAYGYARYVGQRYRDRAVIFILGGDRNAETREDLAIARAMARGLKETAPRNLVTYHPRGPGRSSDYFHKDRWLDFNMFQSSHAARDFDNGVFAEHDRGLRPTKPTLDGEPRYEAIPVGFYLRTADRSRRFDDYDVRQAAYWSLLAGAAGHTYGNNNIWQMWAPGRNAVIHADTPWSAALDHPGAFQMAHVRRLFESRPWTKLVPDQAMIVGPNPPNGGFVRAARASDGSFAFVYAPRGEMVTLDHSRLRARDVAVWLYDPRYGTAVLLHAGLTGTGVVSLTPPTSGRGADWVLVLDDASKSFPPPGTTAPAAARAPAPGTGEYVPNQ
jgi:hypothetical protein